MATNFTQATDLGGRAVRATNFALDNWWLWPLLVVAAFVAWRLYRRQALIARLDERADAAFGDVDAMLLERQALVGNLAEVVRAFATREHDVIRDVLDARVDALEAMGGQMSNDHQVANVLQNLFSVSDNYPALASSAHYGRLREDLIRIEDRITAGRRFYNLTVEESNAVQRAFPGNLFPPKVAPREKFSLGERRAEFVEPVRIAL